MSMEDKNIAKIVTKFDLQDFNVEKLTSDFDGYEVYAAFPKGGAEDEPLYVGIPMVFLVKDGNITVADTNMAILLLEKFDVDNDEDDTE